jgi:hypothetical protein
MYLAVQRPHAALIWAQKAVCQAAGQQNCCLGPGLRPQLLHERCVVHDTRPVGCHDLERARPSGRPDHDALPAASDHHASSEGGDEELERLREGQGQGGGVANRRETSRSSHGGAMQVPWMRRVPTGAGTHCTDLVRDTGVDRRAQNDQPALIDTARAHSKRTPLW